MALLGRYISNIKRVIADLLFFYFSTRIFAYEFFRVSFKLDFSLQIFSIAFNSDALLAENYIKMSVVLFSVKISRISVDIDTDQETW